MFLKKSRRALLSILLIPLFLLQKNVFAADQSHNSLYDALKHHYLATTGSFEEDALTLANGRTFLTEHEKINAFLKTLKKKSSLKVQSHFLPQQWHKAHLFIRDEISQQSIMSMLEHHLLTTTGKVMCASMLTQPTTDVSTLIDRQTALEELIDDEKLSSHIMQQLTIIQRTEESLFSFWYDRDHERYKPLYEPLTYGSNEGKAWKNRSWKFLEATRRFGDFLNTVPLILYHTGISCACVFHSVVCRDIDGSFDNVTEVKKAAHDIAHRFKDKTTAVWKLRKKLYKSMFTKKDVFEDIANAGVLEEEYQDWCNLILEQLKQNDEKYHEIDRALTLLKRDRDAFDQYTLREQINYFNQFNFDDIIKEKLASFFQSCNTGNDNIENITRACNQLDSEQETFNGLTDDEKINYFDQFNLKEIMEIHLPANGEELEEKIRVLTILTNEFLEINETDFDTMTSPNKKGLFQSWDKKYHFPDTIAGRTKDNFISFASSVLTNYADLCGRIADSKQQAETDLTNARNAFSAEQILERLNTMLHDAQEIQNKRKIYDTSSFIRKITKWQMEMLDRESYNLTVYKGFRTPIRCGVKGATLCDAALNSFFLYRLYKRANIVSLSQKLRQKMKSLRECLHAMDALVTCAEKNDCLETVISHKGASLKDLRTKISNLNTLLCDLSSWSVRFPSCIGYFLFPVGKAYAAHELMRDIKEDFQPLLQAAGEIDVYHAVAKLISSHSQDKHFCFTTYNTNPRPQIHASALWDPLDHESKPHDITITEGSNMPKKLMRNNILSFVFGIAAADRFSITPHTEHILG